MKATELPGIFEAATETGIISWMAHGWRPISARIHPACEAA